MSAEQAALFVETLQGLDTVTHVEAGAAAMFIYDYLITLGMEIDLVWFSKWSIVKVIFLFQRYSPFFDSFSLWLIRQHGTHSGQVCNNITYALSFTSLLGIIASEILLGIRVRALWSHNKWISRVLPVIFILAWIPSCVGSYFFAASLKYSDIPPYPSFTGCFVIGIDAWLIMPTWSSFLVWDTFSLILVLIPGIQAYRTGALSGLGSVVYREGSIYYLLIFIMSAMNILIYAVVQDARRAIVTTITRYFHTMLASRALLHMREQAYATDFDGSPTSIVSNIFREETSSNNAGPSGPVYKLRRLRGPEIS